VWSLLSVLSHKIYEVDANTGSKGSSISSVSRHNSETTIKFVMWVIVRIYRPNEILNHIGRKIIITFQEAETEGYPLFRNKIIITEDCECYKAFIYVIKIYTFIWETLTRIEV
jgi:predicted aspartyl protease